MTTNHKYLSELERQLRTDPNMNFKYVESNLTYDEVDMACFGARSVDEYEARIETIVFAKLDAYYLKTYCNSMPLTNMY